MAISRKLDILMALTAHLETITVLNGYEHDLTGRVFRGHAVWGDEMSLPMVSVLEAPRPDERARLGGHERAFRSEDWMLMVQGWVEDDKANPTDPAYALQADVEKCLSRLVEINEANGRAVYPESYRLGNRVSAITIGPGVVSPARERVSAKAFFYLPLVVTIGTSSVSPFAT
jgi:hypothetical protein